MSNLKERIEDIVDEVREEYVGVDEEDLMKEILYMNLKMVEAEQIAKETGNMTSVITIMIRVEAIYGLIRE